MRRIEYFIAFGCLAFLIYSAVQQEGRLRLGGKVYVETKALGGGKGAQLPSRSGLIIGPVAFSEDGGRLALGGGRWNPWPTKHEGQCKVWNTRSKEQEILSRSFDNPVQTLAFSPKGDLLAIGHGNYSLPSKIEVLTVADGKPIESYDVRPGSVRSICFTPDAQFLVYCAAEFDTLGLGRGWINGNVQVIDRIKMGKSHVFKSVNAACTSVILSKDGKVVLAGGDEATPGREGRGLIWVWDFPNGNNIHLLNDHDRIVESIALSDDGKVLAAGDMSGILKLWDLVSGRPLGSFEPRPHNNCRIFAVSMSSDNREIAVALGSWNRGNQWGELQLWDIQAKSRLGTLMKEPGSPIVSVAFARDGRSLVAAVGNGALKVWSISGD